jgi:hypothetical protein
MTARGWMGAATVLWILACVRASKRVTAASDFLPAIVRLLPAAGPAGTAYPIQVTIEGRNFADSANTITFGSVTLDRVASADGGTRIVFYAPKEVPSTGEVPPAPLLPGAYEVKVSTPRGSSNVVTFVLTRSPGGRP